MAGRRLALALLLVAPLGACATLIGIEEVHPLAAGDASTDGVDGADTVVDTASDGIACGQVGLPCCSGTCTEGACCASGCVDLAGDPANCGACGRACSSCDGGACEPIALYTYTSFGYNPNAMKVDSRNAYLSDSTAIYAIPIDGGGVDGGQVVALASGFTDIAGFTQDATNLYVPLSSASKVLACSKSTPSCTPSTPGLAASNLSTCYPESVAYDGTTNLVVSCSGSSKIEQIATAGAYVGAIASPYATWEIATDGTRAYWANGFNNEVGVAALGQLGSGAHFATATGALSVAADAQHVVFATDVTNISDILACVTGASCTSPTTLATNYRLSPSFDALAVDDGNAYFFAMDGLNSTFLYRCAIAGCNGKPLLLASYQGSVQHTYAGPIAVDATYVYYALWDNGTTLVLKVAK